MEKLPVTLLGFCIVLALSITSNGQERLDNTKLPQSEFQMGDEQVECTILEVTGFVKDR